MKISVAMCTYNGARFLQEQLDSLVSQARQPDEVIVLDDRSADDTADVVRRWERRAPFSVRIEVNSERLGSTRNFDKAISMCSGDLVALCDHDDVWLEHKLAEAESAFATRPRLGIWFTDAALADEHLQPLPLTLWETLCFNSRLQRRIEGPGAFNLLLNRPLVTGATLVFPTRFRELIRPIPLILPSFIHDRWIATTIAAVAPVACSSTPSMLYRQHARQQIGVSAASKRPSFADALLRRLSGEQQPYLDDLVIAETLKERLSASTSFPSAAAAAAFLDERIRLLKMRTQLSSSRWRRAIPIATAVVNGTYRRQARGIPSALKDLMITRS